VRPVLLAFALALLLAAPAAGQAPTGPMRPRSEPAPSIADGSAQRKLDTARRRWRRTRIHNYRFELSRACFCPMPGPIVVFVRDDRPVKPPASLRDVATVRRLFRRVQEAIDDEVAGLGVTYDHRGIPRSIGIDGSEMIADDEISYRVGRFWRGTRGRGGPAQPR
jgi:uncharacterized protein DUF6174